MAADSDDTRHGRMIQEQFARQAATFQEFALLPGEPRDIVLRLCPISAADVVLDVACGPGVTTCDLASIAGHVTGVDAVSAMIEQGRGLQQRLGLTNVSWQTTSVPPLPFDDGAFSLVFTRYSLHHFLDPLSVLAEMIRTCHPGGRVVVIDLFMQSEEQRAAYDTMERLRDPSHVRALLLEELQRGLQHVGLTDCKTVFYRLPMTLSRLMSGSFPNPGDAARVQEIMAGDLNENRMGLNLRLVDGEIHFDYPIAALVGHKPSN
ncbi:MAG: methyltransferase domain-containing protein [Pirellulales bacterium]